MRSEELSVKLLGFFEKSQMPHMLVGSFSSSYHGVPRSTKDADIVAHFDVHSWRVIAEILREDLELESQGL